MNTKPNALLSRVEAAKYIGVATQTLAAWASTKRYEIPYIKVGRTVKYRRRHLDEWLESRTVQAQSE